MVLGLAHAEVLAEGGVGDGVCSRGGAAAGGVGVLLLEATLLWLPINAHSLTPWLSTHPTALAPTTTWGGRALLFLPTRGGPPTPIPLPLATHPCLECLPQHPGLIHLPRRDVPRGGHGDAPGEQLHAEFCGVHR